VQTTAPKSHTGLQGESGFGALVVAHRVSFSTASRFQAAICVGCGGHERMPNRQPVSTCLQTLSDLDECLLGTRLQKWRLWVRCSPFHKRNPRSDFALRIGHTIPVDKRQETATMELVTGREYLTGESALWAP